MTQMSLFSTAPVRIQPESRYAADEALDLFDGARAELIGMVICLRNLRTFLERELAEREPSNPRMAKQRESRIQHFQEAIQNEQRNIEDKLSEIGDAFGIHEADTLREEIGL